MRSLKLLFVAACAVLAGSAVSAPNVAPQSPLAPAPQAQTDQLPVSGSGGAPQMTATDVRTWLDGFMPYAMARGSVAGAVVVVVKDGQVLVQQGYGYSDVAKRRPVDPETTMFRPGSVSKLFTWTAVMQQVEAGRLDLDRDVNDYLDFKIPPYEGKPVTLRNIMTHTAGFEESLRGLIGAGDRATPLGEEMKRWVPKRIFAPGTTPAYSNYATALAGYIVERVSGQSFDDYVDANIFGRLGMRHSTFRQPLPKQFEPFMSKGYALASGDPKPYEIVNAAPAGSMAASGADMARFMIAHLNQGGPLLRPETARMMHRTHLDILPPLNRMALGFYEADRNGRAVIAHGGDTQWFHSNLSLFIDDNVGIYISLNSAGKEGVTGAIRNALLSEFADRYFPAPPPMDGRVDAETAKQHARMMAGTYHSSRRAESSFMRALGLAGQVKVGVDKDGALRTSFYTDLGGEPRKWVEIAPFVWRDANGSDRLAAKVENGRVVRFSVDGVAPIMMMDRVPWYRSSAWLTPAVLASLAVLAITTLLWPAAAIARRRYGATLALQGNDRKAYRLVRIFGALALALLVGWAFTLSTMMSDLAMLGGVMDPVVWLLQIGSAIVFFGFPVIAAWNLWLAWTGKRGWASRLWSVVLLLASLAILWAALAFKLISFGVQY